MPLQSRHLLGLDGMRREDIQLILDTAVSFREVLDRPIKKVPPLQGKTVANMFFENSTRTRLSFELAERRLSADVLGFCRGGSSVSKGETLKDTARNIEAMKVDMVVMRHAAAGAPHYLSRVIDANVDQRRRRRARTSHAGPAGYVHHPREAGTTGRAARVHPGDISHSRVARSNIFGLMTMGARVSVCGPATMIPRDIEQLGVEVYHTSMTCCRRSTCSTSCASSWSATQAGSSRHSANTIPSTASHGAAGKSGPGDHDHASRADQPGRGDFCGRRRQRAFGDPPAGVERRRRPDGGALPAVDKKLTSGLGRHMQHSSEKRTSHRPGRGAR